MWQVLIQLCLHRILEYSYLSEKRIKAYDIVRDFRSEIEDNDLFEIDASFMPKSGEVNYQSISSEGYIFKYEPQSRQA